VSKYLAEHVPAGTRIALAGRSEPKLAELRHSITDSGSAVARDIGIVVADALDETKIGALVRSTRVVIGAAGPFAKFGSPLALAAARSGTHYADITGEAAWVRSVIDEVHEEAKRTGTIVVPMSGFDSVPADLGVAFAVRTVREKTGKSTRAVRAYAKTRGAGMSGGTIASGLNMASDPAASRLGADPLCMIDESLGADADSAVKAPVTARPGSGAVAAMADRWWFDWRDEVGAYAAPWPMEAVNTRCVRRSAALAAASGSPLSGPGEAFAYTEWLATGRFQTALSASLGGVVLRTIMGIPGAVSLLSGMLPAPGSGPTDEAMARGTFEYTFVAEPSGTGSEPVITMMRGAMDPYVATAVFVAQAAMLLAHKPAELPGHAGGVLTPAFAFRRVLQERLEETGHFSFTVGRE